MSPDGPAKPPPEEKLLKLIREKGAVTAAVSATGAGGASASTSGVLAAEDALRARQFPWPKAAVIVLSLALVVEVGWLTTQTLRSAPAVDAPIVRPPPVKEIATPEPQPTEHTPSLVESASPALFTPPVAVETAGHQTPVKAGPSQTAKQLASRLTLMGIMAGNPGQAIIEDAQTKKSYFVSPGQPVVDGATLDQVLDNRVILDFEGEKIELSL
ncbi:MAG: hypothetical protein HY352_05720 [Candidatus Omnitrophica bacterium]|nr:hypothetical protein [Candidatus Omnitrophota bacterium]